MPDERENNDPSSDVIDAEIVDAKIVPAVLGNDLPPHSAEVLSTVHPDFRKESALDTNVDRLSAKGGAVGGVLLAVFGLVGLAISIFSVFNLMLAFGFSIWGLKSPLRKTAFAGALISMAGMVVSFFL